jgi:hypothetical protein
MEGSGHGVFERFRIVVLRRVRDAWRLAAAMQRFEDCLRLDDTPDEACVQFDRQRMTFTVSWNGRTESGWPLLRAIEKRMGIR